MILMTLNYKELIFALDVNCLVTFQGSVSWQKNSAMNVGSKDTKRSYAKQT